MGSFGIYDWIAAAGLSDVITGATVNSDGSYTLSMSQSDFTDLYANTQQYFQSCGCPDLGNLQDAWRQAILHQTVTLLVYEIKTLQWLGIIKAQRTPVQGQTPNSVQTYPKPGEKPCECLVPTARQSAMSTMAAKPIAAMTPKYTTGTGVPGTRFEAPVEPPSRGRFRRILVIWSELYR